MAGLIKYMIDNIIEKRSKGHPIIANMTKNKLIINGINPANYSYASDDDPEIIKKLEEFAISSLTTEDAPSVEIAHTENKSIIEAVSQLKFSLLHIKPRFIIYFASSEYDQRWLAAEMKYAFPNAEVFGCSTAGELVSGKMLSRSIVAMAFSSSIADKISLQVVENLSEGINLLPAVKGFEKYFGYKFSSLNFEQYAGIVLIDGVSTMEETLMEKLGVATDVIFVGASAGDDLKFQETFIHANGKAYKDAALLALMKPETEFGFIKTQSFTIRDEVLLASKVKEEEREIVEFNHKPASLEYARVLNIPVEDLDQKFISNPVGLIVDDEPFVRSPQRVMDTSMKFYCSVKEGMELRLLEATDIIGDTKQVIDDVVKKHGSISGLINFNCILRALELQQKGLEDVYGKIFTDIPTIGFNTYGEEYLGHMNQTSTMIYFT